MNKINIKKAFTLVELMVVIAIVWIMSLLSTSIDFNKKNDIEKTDRIIQKISSILKSQSVNMIGGKSIKVWSVMINPDYMTVRISTWTVSTYFFSWSTSYTWEIFSFPFYWENLYNIKSVDYEFKNLTTTWAIWAWFAIVFRDWNISFSWSTQEKEAVRIHFTAWYKKNYKKLIFDRRTWSIEIK